MNNYVSKPFEPEQLIETILAMVKPRSEAAFRGTARNRISWKNSHCQLP